MNKDELACNEYLSCFGLRPDAATARHLGCLKEKQGDFEAAACWFEKALQIEPEHADTCFNLGFVLEQAKQPREALLAFENATRLNPLLDRAWFGKGLAHAAMGEHSLAVADFAEAARLQPMNPDAFYQLGMAGFHSGDLQRTRSAIKALRRFDAHRANMLILDTGSTEFNDLVTELPF